jgi:carbamoyltransferase
LSIVLGINAYHGDSAACIVVDGRLVAAAEEERFRRIKHWAGLPTEAIRYCLSEAGATLGSVAHIAVNSDPRANLARKVAFALSQRPDRKLIGERLRNAAKRVSLTDELERDLKGGPFRGKVHRVEHHLAHLSSCFHVSPFERAVAISVDGFGDFASAAWGVGTTKSEGTTLRVDGRVLFPHSLGVFYQAITQFLGFPHYGDEYKVMGLAPYGEPRYLPEMRRIVELEEGGGFKLALRYFRHHKERIAYAWTGGEPSVGTLFSDALVDFLGPTRDPSQPLTQRHKDLARSAQAMYEEAFFHLLHAAHRRYGGDAVCIAGGCGANSVANGKITLRTPFRHVYVQSAAGDAGGAIGAAFVVAHEVEPSVPRGQMPHAYWGPGYDDAAIDALLEARRAELDAASCKLERFDDTSALCRAVATRIAEGSVVGWFQGRMEWGPRALGNRSILGDPRRADMKDILNLKIKRRESFRPFAPSILRERVDDWFEQDLDVPFMMQVFQVRAEKRALIPAVTHVDGSGRLQTVSAEHNPLYHQLIAELFAQTGVPMVLNTSFNENEPVVCRPEEALDCFLRTRMDVLALGSRVLSRAQPAALTVEA